jgi:hypothetical protein
MSRRLVFSLALGVLLLTVAPAAQSPAFASQQVSATQASQSRLAALTQSYFVALNRALVAGNVSGLRAVFAARATLTERSALTIIEPTSQVSMVHGRSAVIQFYRHLSAAIGRSRWVVGVMNQVSPTTMVAYARSVGTRRTPPVSSMQRLTMRNGTIVSVDLTLYSVN